MRCFTFQCCRNRSHFVITDADDLSKVPDLVDRKVSLSVGVCRFIFLRKNAMSSSFFP